MNRMPVDVHPKCDFFHCLAGQGLAGMGICFLQGDWGNPQCPRFEDEHQWYVENCLQYASQDMYEYGGEMWG
jgi:hypothetical protein